MEDDRESFQDSVQDLSEVLAQPGTFNQVVWKIEYLGQTGWYHFYGLIRDGKSSGIGHLYDRLSGETTNISPDNCVSIALAFNINPCITVYRGANSVSTNILDEVESRGVSGSEVIRIGIEARVFETGGRSVKSLTDIAYVGLSQSDDALLIPSATSQNQPSLKWCRNRRFISSLPIPEQTGDSDVPWL